MVSLLPRTAYCFGFLGRDFDTLIQHEFVFACMGGLLLYSRVNWATREYPAPRGRWHKGPTVQLVRGCRTTAVCLFRMSRRGRSRSAAPAVSGHLSPLLACVVERSAAGARAGRKSSARSYEQAHDTDTRMLCLRCMVAGATASHNNPPLHQPPDLRAEGSGARDGDRKKSSSGSRSGRGKGEQGSSDRGKKTKQKKRSKDPTARHVEGSSVSKGKSPKKSRSRSSSNNRSLPVSRAFTRSLIIANFEFPSRALICQHLHTPG